MHANRIMSVALVCLALAAPAAAEGSLARIEGVRVLRLGGTPFERGLAQGRALAPSIVAVFRAYMPFLAGLDRYEEVIRPEVASLYEFPPHMEAELAGMYAGLAERLGAEALTPALAGLDRPLDLLDLRCIQTLTDWYPFACSVMLAWGELSPGGPLVARNLDFFNHPVLMVNHLIVYHEAAEGRRGFVSVGFPGLVGAVSGMNEDGVAVMMLDSNAPLADPPKDRRMLPRMAALRLALEGCSPEDPAGDAMRLLGEEPTRWGGLVFVAGPNAAERPEGSGVLESAGGRTVLRTAAASPVKQGASAHAVTNHFRLLAAPVACARYDAIAEACAAGRPFDEASAFDLLWRVRQTHTLQSMVLDLKNRRIALRLFGIVNFIRPPKTVRLGFEAIAGTAD